MAANRTAQIRFSRSWIHLGIHRFWWVVAFVALCSAIYLHAIQQKDLSYRESIVQLKALEKEKALALARHEELSLQIQSQSDPAWVEMVLKRNLGMVPEGQTKVYFHQD